jgi:multiple sugar transport system ATP-binding protein
MADLRLENVSKHYGEVKAVDDVSLDVKDGELLTLLGPSGSGKTTTMRLVAGLEEPTAGKIFIGGILVNDLAPRERDVAMVFQSYGLYPHMNVYDNMAFPLRMRKIEKTEIETKVRKAAGLLDIDRLLKRKPKELSGGEQQRVALGRAIVREPKVFLMDEPLSNLDAKLRLYMRAELKALQNRLGVTTIYVTHDQVEAMTMSDRIALMDHGSLSQVGTPDDLYSHPASEFVGGFVGSPPMNFIEGNIAEKKNRLLFDCTIFNVDVTEWQSIIREKASGSEVILGIRPEDIDISDKEAQEGIAAEIYVIEPLGSELIITFKLGDSTIKVRSPTKATPRLTAGKRVSLSLNRNIHIFDKKTGMAIF